MGLEITYTLGARGICRLETLDKKSRATAYRPTLDEPLLISNELGTVTLFLGSVLSVKDRALGEPNVGVVTTVEAADQTRALDARLVSAIYPAGMTLKAIVSDLVTTYAASFGITLDPGMAAGPVLSIVTFETATLTGALGYLSELTGWVWRVRPDAVLEMFAIGTKVAAIGPLTSSNSKILGGVQWSKTRGKFVNRQFLKYGPDSVLRMADVFTATAGQSVFPLTYPAQASRRNSRSALCRMATSGGRTPRPLLRPAAGCRACCRFGRA